MEDGRTEGKKELVLLYVEEKQIRGEERLNKEREEKLGSDILALHSRSKGQAHREKEKERVEVESSEKDRS